MDITHILMVIGFLVAIIGLDFITIFMRHENKVIVGCALGALVAFGITILLAVLYLNYF